MRSEFCEWNSRQSRAWSDSSSDSEEIWVWYYERLSLRIGSSDQCWINCRFFSGFLAFEEQSRFLIINYHFILFLSKLSSCWRLGNRSTLNQTRRRSKRLLNKPVLNENFSWLSKQIRTGSNCSNLQLGTSKSSWKRIWVWEIEFESRQPRSSQPDTGSVIWLDNLVSLWWDFSIWTASELNPEDSHFVEWNLIVCMRRMIMIPGRSQHDSHADYSWCKQFR